MVTSLNPFTYGNVIHDPNHFVGRKRELSKIFSLLYRSSSVSIMGELRMGKSSLLAMLATPSVIQRFGLDPYLPVYVSLDTLEQNATPTQLWKIILLDIREKLENREDVAAQLEILSNQEHIHFHDLKKFLRILDHRIVLLLDEFEALASNPNFGTSFFGQLRALVDDSPLYKIAVVTASRIPVSEIEPSKLTSPFGSMLYHVLLDLFSSAEAYDLIRHAMRDAPFQFRNTEIDQIISIAGRHPCLLQIASHNLYQAYLYGMDRNKRLKYLNDRFYQETKQHFDYIWKRSSSAQKICLAALALLSHYDEANRIGLSTEKLSYYIGGSQRGMRELEDRRLVIDGDAGYQIFSSTFANWIIDEIKVTLSEPQEYDAWLQSREARSGLASLSRRVGDEVTKEVLPRVATRYRELIVTWLSDPKTIENVLTLLRSTLG